MSPRFEPGGRARRALGAILRPLPESSRRRLRGLEARYEHRRSEREQAKRVERIERDEPGLPSDTPVPPALLRIRVSGPLADRDRWLQTSATDARLIREMLIRAGRPIEGMSALLDFGCGCGRIARHWGALEGPEIHGADVSRPAVRWCRRHLPHVRAVRSGPSPPLPYPARRFEFVYALSVLTHMPEAAGDQWIEELTRVLEPGGLLLFTVHGERFAGELDARGAARFRAGEMVTTEEPPELAGSNAFAAFHPPVYVRERLLARHGLELVEAVYEGPEGGVTPVTAHDNYLARKPG